MSAVKEPAAAVSAAVAPNIEVISTDTSAVYKAAATLPVYNVESTDEEETVDPLNPDTYDRALLGTMTEMEQESKLPVTPPIGSIATAKLTAGPHVKDLSVALDTAYRMDAGNSCVASPLAGRPSVTRFTTDGVPTYLITSVVDLPPLPPRVKTRSATKQDKKKKEIATSVAVCIFPPLFLFYTYVSSISFSDALNFLYFHVLCTLYFLPHVFIIIFLSFMFITCHCLFADINKVFIVLVLSFLHFHLIICLPFLSFIFACFTMKF